MKVAFLFEEKCPNYQHTFQLVDALTPAERDSLDCSISKGVWGLNDPRCGLGADRMDDREGVVARLFFNRAGSMTAFRGPESIQFLARANVFVVLVSSIRPAVARGIHERLLARDARYHGFIQALPHAPGHGELFSWLERSVVIAEGKVLVVHHGENDEFLADEMLGWVRDKHNWLITVTSKHDAEFEHSVFDANSGRERALDFAISSLNEEWAACSEPTLARLHAVAPEACRELLAAIESLGDVELDAATCRKVSINLRRCMELLADVLAPQDPTKKDEGFQCRLKRHIKTRLKPNKNYAAYLDADLTELAKRMETLWKLLHKGVHEDWMHTALPPLLLRMMLLIRELLLPVKPVASRVVLEDDLFN